MKDTSIPATAWNIHKEQAKGHFQQHDYAQALSSYLASLEHCPFSERQVLLSNIVACRLKLGGQALAAVQDAKNCVSLNESWPKGHVRLASAYIALGGHSNYACNALQRALALDPNNTVARQMLRAELRRDGPIPVPSAPPAEQDDDGHQDPNTDVDDSLSWSDRLKLASMRAITWYHEQPEDTKTLLKVLGGMLILYFAFGGRFGLEHLGERQKRGNYGHGNAYEQYRQRQGNKSPSYTHDEQTQRRTTHQNDNTERNYKTQFSSTNQSSSGFPNLFDGSLTSMIVLAAFAFTCHKFGVNPFHAIFLLNRFTGNRGRGMNRMGMYGMGYGMARNQFGNGGYGAGPRPRNRWF